jgi:hypothetical protein
MPKCPNGLTRKYHHMSTVIRWVQMLKPGNDMLVILGPLIFRGAQRIPFSESQNSIFECAGFRLEDSRSFAQGRVWAQASTDDQKQSCVEIARELLDMWRTARQNFWNHFALNTPILSHCERRKKSIPIKWCSRYFHPQLTFIWFRFFPRGKYWCQITFHKQHFTLCGQNIVVMTAR